MIKKILLFLVTPLLFLTLATTTISYGATVDQKIDVEIIKDGTTLTINHLSGLKIDYAVIEFSYMRDEEKISELGQFKVTNNKVSIQSNWIAIKLHQVKSLKNQVYYTYATQGSNTIGSFSNVVRINITDVKTIDVVSKKYSKPLWYLPDFFGQTYFYWEFYFDIPDIKPERIRSVTLDYVAYTREAIIPYLWYSERDHERKVEKVYDHEKMTNNLFKLEENKGSDIQSDYVVRFANKVATNTTSGGLRYHNWVENVAMIQIEYKIDGEFIVSDVVNDPTTPEQDKLDWLFDFIDKLQKIITKVTSFFTSNANVIIKVVVFIGLVIAYVIFSPFLKLGFGIIKLFFKGVISILAKLFGWLF